MIRFKTFRELTRLEQTLFALPFILSALIFAMQSSLFQWKEALWVLPCFLLARISGMAFNQWIDCRFDAKNPRTQNRVIPRGAATLKQAQWISWVSLLLFLLLALRINLLVAFLAPLAAGSIFIYSYMKRIHVGCHLVLGLIHFLGPLMAYAACCRSITLPILFLSGAAACAIVGSDIIYAIQDYEFDCKNRLFSLPARMGMSQSLKVAALFHLSSLLCLFCIGLFSHARPIYYVLLPLIGSYLFWFHRQVWQEIKIKGDFKKMERSFFLCHVVISSLTFFFVCMNERCL